MVVKKTTQKSTKPATKPATIAQASALKKDVKLDTVDSVSAKTADPTIASVAPDVKEPMLRKKELVERVTSATGVKRRDAKLVVEATLKVLGDALADGEVLMLPPLGKVRVNRQKDLASGEMLMVKIRRGGNGPADKDSVDERLAEAAE